VIVLELPDHSQLRFDDADARGIADRLWELARKRGGTAVLAISIDAELQRNNLVRRAVEVSPFAAERLAEVLAERA
jgi:hypothetical protein